MDTNIRTLLTVSQNSEGEKSNAHLQQAFELLHSVAENRATHDGPETVGQDLFVLCAEQAYQHGHPDIAKDCLKMYFLKTPPANQFLCRAYLCQATILAPKSAENPEQIERAVVYLVKAINMAKENPRYHFLVYNASVIYWQFCRPFLKPKYQRYLAQSLHQVVKALDDIDDKDYEWRAQLMIALIECHMDAGHKTDASNVASAALSFIKQNVPTSYKTVFGLMVRHQLADASKFQKEMKTSAELNVFYRLCKLKVAIDQKNSEVDVYEEMRKILLSMGASEEKFPPREVVPKESSKEKTGRRSTTPEAAERPMLLLELARLSLEQNEPDIAAGCVELIKEAAHLISDQGFFLEIEFVQAELMVRSIGVKQEAFNKAIVEVRLSAIKRCEEAVVSAVRLGNEKVLQAGCATQWNLCLPILQQNLRHHVRRPLTVLAEALKGIDSLLVQLRCQIHMELSKIEEDGEQIEPALEHLRCALALDDGNVYQERLNVALNRLTLRAELYKQPDRAEDLAAMIIEQARKADSGTIRMKRSQLVKAGQALAPDAFLLVLESENEPRDVAKAAIAPGAAVFRKVGMKARQFKSHVKKAEGHLRRLGDQDDRERARLWGDLAKTARKQEVWDVCRVASRFCLLYDDSRWKNELPQPKDEKEKPKSARGKSQDREGEKETSDAEKSGSDMLKDKSMGKMSKGGKTDDSGSDRSSSPERTVPVSDKDLIRMMAEVNFINGEALIHLLRSEGVELNNKPIPPVDKSKKPKGYVAIKPSENEDWIEYCAWLDSLSAAATACFVRATALSVELEEPWIVCSAAAYVWNYNNHVLQERRHAELTSVLDVLLDGMKKVGHAEETVLLVNICTGLATGLLLPWLPAPPSQAPADTQPSHPQSPTGRKTPKPGKGDKGAKGKQTGGPVPVTISPDATPHLKKAVEVCEFAMRVTNGDNPQDVVPIASRHPLLQTWVQAKQMLMQQIPKSYGTAEEEESDGQKPMTRAMVAMEMMSLNSSGINEFKDAPQLDKAFDMLDAPNWTDKLVELQLWARLASLAYDAKDHKIVAKCALRALQFAETGTTPKGKKIDPHKYLVEQEMLSYAACIYGQSLSENTQGKNSIRRKAMAEFLSSAKFACQAGNNEMVVTAARHYWNAALPLINQPMERELLQEPIEQLLDCISLTTDKNMYKKSEEEEEEAEAAAGAPPPVASTGALAPVDMSPAGVAQSQAEVQKSIATGIIGGPDDDLTLRASLYGVLFQSYADKGEWEAGLKAMDKAIAAMPRTNHRLLIFKHLVVVKAKLGLDVGMSIQKFKDESEDYVAHMWRRVALCSKEQLEQLAAYQNAIESLTSSGSEWQKFDYLLEFGQWLYCNDFSLQDAINQFEWAIDLMLNMKFQDETKVETSRGKRGKTPKKGKTPPASALKARKDKSPGKKTVKKDSKEEGAGKKSPVPSEKSLGTNDDDTTQTDYVPVKKQVVIGVLPNNPSLQISDLKDVRQLEGLFRAHVLLAQVSGRAAPQYKDYLLMAYSYLMRMWQVSVGSCGPIIKELAKLAAAEPPPTKGSAKGKPGKKVEKEPVKERPKRKGPLDALPAGTEEWAVYDAPDEALEAFKADAMKSTGINKHTITKPSLTILYLEQMSSALQEVGYHHLNLPVLAMADVLSRSLLNNKPLNSKIHLRAMDVCMALNLSNGIHFHEKQAEFKLNEDDQAKCREEIVIWKEKQAQVEKEELRIKESLLKLKHRQSAKSAKDVELAAKLSDDDSTALHLGRQIGAIEFRDTWTDTAEVLINNALYQPAREMLNEALQAAVAFSDTRLEARILLLLARLSHKEAQYGQTVNLALRAQRTYNGDEMFWYETTMVMVDATLLDHQLNQNARLRKGRGLLAHAIRVFRDVEELRPNKISIIGFIMAKLYAKLGSVQVQIAILEYDDITQAKVSSALLNACQKMSESCERLVELDYKKEAMEVMKEHADLLIKLAREVDGKEDIHALYLQALAVMRRALEVSDMTWYDVHMLSSIQEMRQVSTPAQRENASIKLACGELMVEMYALYVEEDRRERLANIRKGSVLRTLEEFVAEDPSYSNTERQWADTSKILGATALSLLSNVHSMSNNIPLLRAKSLCQLGRCLRLLSLQVNPDRPMQWTVQEMELLSIKEQLSKEQPVQPQASNIERAASSGGHTDRSELLEGGTSSNGGDEDEEDGRSSRTLNDRNADKYSQQAQKDQSASELATHYLTQATECLTQAVNLSLTKGFKAIIAASSLELVECFGQFEPSLCSQYLALHQSAANSVYLENLLRVALVDPNISQQGALLHQMDNLKKADISGNRSIGPVMQEINAKLQEISTAWKRLEVLPNHLELLRDFPPNFTFVLLQHSPDKKYLYASIMDKPAAAKPGGAAGKASQKNAALGPVSKAQVVRVKNNAKVFEDLLTKWRTYKQDLTQFLLKMQYQRSIFAQREAMLSKLDDTGKKDPNRISPEESLAAEEKKLDNEFLELLEGMENYLQPITCHLETMLRPSSASSSQPEKEKARTSTKETAAADTSGPTECMVLLADPLLLELPLESLRAFHGPTAYDTIMSVSRDISLQMLHHKNMQEVIDSPEHDRNKSAQGKDKDKKGSPNRKGSPSRKQAAGGKDAKKGDAKKEKNEAAEKAKKDKDKNKPPSRIPGVRDANKKTAKIIPLDRPIPPGYHGADTHNFKYIVDPYLDVAETEEKKPVEVMAKVIEEHVQQFTPRWIGLSGTEHIPSPGEYEIYLAEASGFVFYGMEHLTCYLPPYKVASMNLPETQLIVLFDRCQSNMSFQRKSKADVLKAPEQISLERPVETSLLLGLTGARCVMSNQWYCTAKENAGKLDQSMKDLLAKGRSTGHTVRYLFNPEKRRQDEQAELDALNPPEDKPPAAPFQEGGDAVSEVPVEEETKEEEDEESQEPARSCYNMVCYGVPNMIVTQIGKV